MRSTLTAAVLFLALFPAACTSPSRAPSPGMNDPYLPPVNNPDISVLSPDLQQWLAFHPAIVVRGGRDPMRVEIPARNMADRAYLIDYRYIFQDENGAEVEPVMGWKMEKLEAKQVVHLKAGALDSAAKTYRLEVKWSR